MMNFKLCEDKLNGLDLFSGIGGNTIGLREYIKTIAYCEADRHAQSVLLSRMSEGSIEPAPIWTDIASLKVEQFDIQIDIIVGGFPCQDISVAGKGEGIVEGNRSGLFYEVVRLAKEIKPTFLFLENVPAIRTRGLDTVIQKLTEIGYDIRWTMLSAADVGAPHKRERWFALAIRRDSYSTDTEYLGREPASNDRRNTETICNGSEGENGSSESARMDLSSNVANTNCVRKLSEQREYERTCNGSWWETEPRVGRVVDGVPFRVDRIKRLGNAVVPIQAKKAFEKLIFIK